MAIVISIQVPDEPLHEISLMKDTCSDDDIDVLCFAMKRHLRLAFGRAPFDFPKPPRDE